LLKQSLTTGVPLLGASTSRKPANLLEGVRGEASTSTAADAAELDALYHDLPTYQPESAGRKEAEETVVTEPISLPTTSVGEMPEVSLTMPILGTTELKVITSPSSLTMVIEPTFPKIVPSPTSVVAGVLVSMRLLRDHQRSLILLWPVLLSSLL